MTDKMTYRWLWNCLIAGGLLMLSGCADNNEDLPQPEGGSQLELRAVTRTDGAANYAGNQNIRIFLTTSTDREPGELEFVYSATGWSSNISVKEERQYYIYGYMPSSITGNVSVEGEGLNNDYSNGVDLTLSGMPAITSNDICVIVGVQRVTSTTGSETPNDTIGNYGYRSGIKGQNAVNLLMAHLYSGLELKFMIGEEYSKLRSIRLNEVTLNCTYPTVNAIVNIRKGQGLGTPDFTSGSGNSVQTAVMFSDVKKLETVADVITTDMAYCAPILSDGTTLTITSKYDVYDKSNNMLASRESSNKVQIAASALKPGQKNTLTLTVKPTYLYILSDDDLDTPTITVN